MGDAQEMRDYADVLDKMTTSLVATYVKRTGQTEDAIRAMLEKDTWLDAKECLALGFIDEMTDPFAASAKFDPDRLPENVKLIFAAKAAPVVEEVNPLADQIGALAHRAGMSEYSARFALSCETIEAAQAAINNAREVAALCALVKAPAAAHINAGTALAAVRQELLNGLADQDENTHVNTTIKISNDHQAGAQPKVVNTAAIWDAYRKQGAKA
jgi:hypothetical protein